jgi:hypothetical protein
MTVMLPEAFPAIVNFLSLGTQWTPLGIVLFSNFTSFV